MLPLRRVRTARLALALAASVAVACAPKPLITYTTDVPPLILAPASSVGIEDQRGRFREIVCEILEARADQVPDARPCEEALVRLENEPPPSGRSVVLGPARLRIRLLVVPGYSYSCLESWIAESQESWEYIDELGFGHEVIRVNGFASTAFNAVQIRKAVLALEMDPDERLVLLGYSKGVPDILEALVSYPEVTERVTAVVSVAGAVGGSVLANDPPEWLIELFQKEGTDCDPGDGGGLESLRSATRRAWLAQNQLPSSVRFFSLVAFPERDQVSTAMRPSYDTLSRVDPRNDGQLIFYDQIVPGSGLLGYVNADHWAVAVPIGRTHPVIAALFADRNAYPREALMEAILRHVEEVLLEEQAQARR